MKQLIGAIAALAATGAASASWAAAEAPDGKALYKSRCGLCHQAGGYGANMLGKRLGADKAVIDARTDLAAPYVTTVVRKGVGSMPMFSKVELPDKELAAIAAYLASPQAKRK